MYRDSQRIHCHRGCYYVYVLYNRWQSVSSDLRILYEKFSLQISYSLISNMFYMQICVYTYSYIKSAKKCKWKKCSNRQVLWFLLIRSNDLQRQPVLFPREWISFLFVVLFFRIIVTSKRVLDEVRVSVVPRSLTGWERQSRTKCRTEKDLKRISRSGREVSSGYNAPRNFLPEHLFTRLSESIA